ncbi:unnamed protein product [Heterosigma akashiwo]|mmetsp:Transcript_9246/g.12929  ORF Transcript_9246/g.12929 Transcript_9246/m.12929 type:complete len:116 (-) Transcript_9246:203-550(-)
MITISFDILNFQLLIGKRPFRSPKGFEGDPEVDASRHSLDAGVGGWRRAAGLGKTLVSPWGDPVPADSAADGHEVHASPDLNEIEPGSQMVSDDAIFAGRGMFGCCRAGQPTKQP